MGPEVTWPLARGFASEQYALDECNTGDSLRRASRARGKIRTGDLQVPPENVRKKGVPQHPFLVMAASTYLAIETEFAVFEPAS